MAEAPVALEDSLWIGKGQLALSNADQNIKISRIAQDLCVRVRVRDEARQMLALKGSDRVVSA